MLFVPLTTVTMDPIPRERMGNATSLFNLMRNIGGSIGIAVTGTMLSRRQQATMTLLGANVTPYSATAQSMFERMRAGFIATGSDAVTATNRKLNRMNILMPPRIQSRGQYLQWNFQDYILGAHRARCGSQEHSE